MRLFSKKKSKDCIVLKKVTTGDRGDNTEVVIFFIGGQNSTKNIDSLKVLDKGSEEYVTITDQNSLLLRVCTNQVKEIEEVKTVIALAKEYKKRANRQ